MKCRVIPTILTDRSTVVKGSNFNNWRTVGTVENSARLFAARDVDELIFLDIKGGEAGIRDRLPLISRFAELLSIPFGVGGGIASIESATAILREGAEKVILGTAAFTNPKLISEIALKFGQQAVTVAIDVADSEGDFIAINSGKKIERCNILEKAVKYQDLGAGEILLQSVARDGTRNGYDLKNIEKISKLLEIPVVASSGAGSEEHFKRAVEAGAAAVAAGAIFQFTQTTPQIVRDYLKSEGIEVRRI